MVREQDVNEPESRRHRWPNQIFSGHSRPLLAFATLVVGWMVGECLCHGHEATPSSRLLGEIVSGAAMVASALLIVVPVLYNWFRRRTKSRYDLK